MGRTYKVGPSGSFGARYGTVARKRYSAVITTMRAPHECPSCHVPAVKRMSVGIWLCGRCGFKFAGGAYAPITKLGQVAERASRAGVASSLLAELKAERAKAMEVEAKAKAVKRRRRRALPKKAEGEEQVAEKPTPTESPPPAENPTTAEDTP
jgi:large subunit ribosomal protein L37Ae